MCSERTWGIQQLIGDVTQFIWFLLRALEELMALQHAAIPWKHRFLTGIFLNSLTNYTCSPFPTSAPAMIPSAEVKCVDGSVWDAEGNRFVKVLQVGAHPPSVHATSGVRPHTCLTDTHSALLNNVCRKDCIYSESRQVLSLCSSDFALCSAKQLGSCLNERREDYIGLKAAWDVCHCMAGRKEGGNGRSVLWPSVIQGLRLSLSWPGLGGSREKKTMQNGLAILLLPSQASRAGNSALQEYLC